MGESNRRQQNSEAITIDELWQAIHHWKHVRHLFRSNNLSEFLGRNCEDAVDRRIWMVPPHVARKIRLLTSPHYKALIKAYCIKNHP